MTGAPEGQQLPEVVCGCGFKVSGVDEARNRTLYNNHPCPQGQETVFQKLADGLYTIWGLLIVCVIATAIGSVVAAVIK